MKMNPRQRRKHLKWLQDGNPKRLPTLFSNPDEYAADMVLVVNHLQSQQYRVSPEAFRFASQVPDDILKSENAADALRLRAAKLIRMVTTDAREIELLERGVEAAKQSQLATAGGKAATPAQA